MPRQLKSRQTRSAALFAALGDETRLSLVARLSGGNNFSISELAETSPLTRQAITKHLRVLERVKLVRNVRHGRESCFAFNPKPIVDAKALLDDVSAQWDQALANLKRVVETSD